MTATILTNLCIKTSFFIEIEIKESDKTFESVKHVLTETSVILG